MKISRLFVLAALLLAFSACGIVFGSGDTGGRTQNPAMFQNTEAATAIMAQSINNMTSFADVEHSKTANSAPNFKFAPAAASIDGIRESLVNQRESAALNRRGYRLRFTSTDRPFDPPRATATYVADGSNKAKTTFYGLAGSNFARARI